MELFKITVFKDRNGFYVQWQNIVYIEYYLLWQDISYIGHRFRCFEDLGHIF